MKKEPADFAEEAAQEFTAGWWWIVPISVIFIIAVEALCMMTYEPTGTDFERATDAPTKWQQH